MKNNTKWKVIAGVALSGSLLVAGSALSATQSNVSPTLGGAQKSMMQGCREMMGNMMGMMSGMSCCAPKTDAGAAAEAKQDTQLQRATIAVKDGYTPGTINVQAGKPLELTFVAGGEGCSNSIRIPALKQSFNLKNGEKKTISFTPQKGTTTFSCAMGMYGGQIVAK
ncbi:MAG TPA: cupredoxin domain-containing protein [Chloroflexota bacterium]|nr:cupredoxin domain-containing protein [Chloroflexota bacterium]